MLAGSLVLLAGLHRTALAYCAAVAAIAAVAAGRLMLRSREVQ
jgi:hypothetical protein